MLPPMGVPSDCSPHQPKKEVGMPTNSPMHSWIRFWIKRNGHEFEEPAKKDREGDLRLVESGVPLRTLELIAQYDLDCHQRNQFPVGAFFDIINSQRHGGVKATAEQLFVVAEVGADLFYAAICTADDEDNAEFFIKAYERWGELVDTALQECSLPNRDVMTGRVRASR